MTILGRTIEHLGTQMYKHRSPSIAELVANCWDAGAGSTWITLPTESDYNAETSCVTIMDDGEGMDCTAVQDRYLVVGRNRRSEIGQKDHGRAVMGRKGIGKLAGFGLAEKVQVTTWPTDSAKAIQFSMTLEQLTCDAGRTEDIKFPWTEVDKDAAWPTSGTRIDLFGLRHTTPIDVNSLVETLARRFSRTTRGEMKIYVNTQGLIEPTIDAIFGFPDDDKYEQATLSNSKVVQYRYRFARKPLRSKELQGFVIYANERTAQAPPFFFNVESTASSQHSTRYVTGEIIADFVDSGTDNKSDMVSTDRQELDWEKAELKELREWGDQLSRKILRDCSELRGKQVENWVLQDKGFATRIELLEKGTQAEISRFLKILGQKSDEQDDRTRDLADSLIRAYEFRTFHDVIDDIEKVGDDPDKLEEVLGRLHDWKVLESRAILEIVRGRLSIIKKLKTMIITDAPETASAKTDDNLHDLLAEYPWLFNPEWQVYTEEKSISKLLRDWGTKDCPEEMKDKRVDFIAFEKDTDALVIIELKRSGHAVEFDELQRLERYQVSLMKSRKNCRRVLVFGGSINIPDEKLKNILNDKDFEVLSWGKLFERARSYYSHYESVLNGDAKSGDFRRKQVEVVRTRQVIESGSSHRSKEDRARGIGNSDL